MKKILVLFITVMITLFLVGCQDKKTYDNRINVIFYTTASGTPIESYLDLEPGSLIEEPEIEPTREGYAFAGWYKDTAGTQRWDFATDRIGNTSIVLYAKWVAGYFKINYVINGGEYPADFKELEDYPEDERDPETNPDLLKYLFFRVGQSKVLFRPTKTGYQFAGWYPYDAFKWPGAPEGTTNSFKPGDPGYTTVPSNIAEDITLYAHWTPISVSITFNANYPVTGVVSNPSSRTLTYGLELIYDKNYDPNSEVKYNRLPDFNTISNLEYEFIGWNTRADGTGTWYREGDIFERTVRITLYAQWSPKA